MLQCSRFTRYNVGFGKTFQTVISIRLQHGNEACTSVEEPKPFSQIPEPKKLPLLGTVLDYSKKSFKHEFMHRHFAKRHEELGSIYKEDVVPGLTDMVVFASTPEDTEYIIRNDSRFPIRESFPYVAKIRRQLGLHEGVVNIQGEEWHKIRKVLNEHLLHNASVWSYAKEHLEVGNDFVDYIERNLDENNEVPNFANALNKWALEGTGVFALDSRFGIFSGNTSENLKIIIENTNELFRICQRMQNSVPVWKIYKNQDFKNLTKVQLDLIKAIHEHREDLIKEKAEKNDALPKFEQIVKDSLLTSSEKDILVVDILSAGVDTTSNAAAFALYCLAMNPDKQEILRSEIKELLNSGEEITGKVLQKMKYMHACNREAQRLFPLVLGTVRQFDKEMVISGYKIPPGIQVVITSNFMNNRDPKYYKEPDSFIPERWLTTSRQANRFAMIGSFGFGVRMCPGRRFSMQEIDCLMVALLSRYKVEYHHKPIELSTELTSKPSEKPQFTFVPLDV